MKVGAMAVAVALAGGLAAPQQEGLTLTLRPDEGPPGAHVTATVNARCQELTVTGGGVVATATADVSEEPPDATEGVSTVQFDAPGDWEAGDVVTLRASCDGRSGTARFRVTGTSDTTEPGTTEPGTTEPTSPGTTAPPAEPPDPPATLDECEAQAREADALLTYEPERRMALDRTHEVSAAVSLDDLPDGTVTFSTDTTEVQIRARCTMRADLAGADFDITRTSDAEQSFLDARLLEWRWDVRPTRAGDDLKLTLRFQAVIREGGEEVPGRSMLHDARISVEAVRASLWSTFVDRVTGVLTHPIIAPVTALGVTTAATAVARRVWRRERDGRPSNRRPRAKRGSTAKRRSRPSAG